MSATVLRPLSLEAEASEFPSSAAAPDMKALQAQLSKQADGNRFIGHFLMSPPLGFHMRPASLFAQTAQRFASTIMVGTKAGKFANGKSIMGLLTLAIMCGEDVVVSVHGEDAADALAAIARLFDDAFGEGNPAAGSIPDFAIGGTARDSHRQTVSGCA